MFVYPTGLFAPHLGAGGDPNFDKVSLLMHMNGANGSTTFTDVKGKTITRSGNAQISTVQSKFDGASGLFDGSGDYLDIAVDSSLQLSTSIFTLEAWVNPANVSGSRMVLSSTPAVFSTGYSIMFLDGKLRFESGGGNPGLTSTLNVITNAWQHIAICKSGNNYYFAVNGVVQTITVATTWTDGTILRIGANARLDFPYFFNGYIDDLRISKGIARYTSSFTPPTSPFPDA